MATFSHKGETGRRTHICHKRKHHRDIKVRDSNGAVLAKRI